MTAEMGADKPAIEFWPSVDPQETVIFVDEQLLGSVLLRHKDEPHLYVIAKHKGPIYIHLDVLRQVINLADQSADPELT